MDTLVAIHTRRSIRTYLNQPVPEELIQKLLAAAMQAPSARNQQPWQFVVIDDRAILAKIPKVMPNAPMAGSAPLAILVCGDLDLEQSEGYWVDCAAAVENLARIKSRRGSQSRRSFHRPRWIDSFGGAQTPTGGMAGAGGCLETEDTVAERGGKMMGRTSVDLLAAYWCRLTLEGRHEEPIGFGLAVDRSLRCRAGRGYA